jgi:hypothetical protein
MDSLSIICIVVGALAILNGGTITRIRFGARSILTWTPLTTITSTSARPRRAPSAAQGKPRRARR